jgi:DSS1/SEM1 family
MMLFACSTNTPILTVLKDWDDSQTGLAHLGGAAPGSAKSGGDKLWEDNWDDDDIEDEFSVQLRFAYNLVVAGISVQLAYIMLQK